MKKKPSKNVLRKYFVFFCLLDERYFIRMAAKAAVAAETNVNLGSIDQIGRVFVQNYYSMFDDKAKRIELASLYVWKFLSR